MKLYLVRHGKAEPADGKIDDHDRPLTADGAARLETTAAVIARLNLKPDHIYSSPRVRARQTAEIIARALHKDVEILEAVDFDFSVQAVQVVTKDLGPDAEIMFVGHNPSMEQVVQMLTGANVMMKVGSLARIDIDLPQEPLRGQLTWLLAPKVFDALAQ
ncbi:MAG: phosphohistidine phosphatase SixA [Anaerolineae bacterium]|jgi:phosphohistidine phosphatase|nr:phosphohistidine phosphatase SixA [Anaerolineae bacterium]